MNKFLKDIRDFHQKFGLGYSGTPRHLSTEEAEFRSQFHFEEAGEFLEGVVELDKAKQLDALVDLVYVALGTAYRMGLPFDKAWDRVHAANMSKQMAANSSESKRGFHLDVVKPEGWAPPVLDDLVEARAENRTGTQLARVIVVEGPDACGKTTLAKTLARELGGVYWHMTRTEHLSGQAQLDYQKNSIENIRDNLNQGKTVVVDRNWISEYIYGRVLRRVGFKELEKIAMDFIALNPFTIYCMDVNAETAAARHRQHIDQAHPYSDQQYIDVYQSYQDFMMNEPNLSGIGGKNATVYLFDSNELWPSRLNEFADKVRKWVSA